MTNAAPLRDLSRLCVHTMTTRPWSLEEAAREYAAAGIRGITVWREALEGRDAKTAGDRLRERGLTVVSLCRGGFFPATTAEGRSEAVDTNRRCIDQAAELGAPLVVLVCGAVPGQPLVESRKQITEAIAALLPHAASARVKLAIEPLHPMYADNRSAISTLEQAHRVCEELASPWLGVAVDVYHVWWDDRLKKDIEACGRARRLFAFHVCDWRTPTVDLLNDRGLMGEGCIPIREIRGWMENAGFDGFIEVEVFSNRLWAMDQRELLEALKTAYRNHC
jgi:sugar phosphate isomerase/epimerase